MRIPALVLCGLFACGNPSDPAPSPDASQPAPSCGDGVCEGSEVGDCPSDCGAAAACGDDQCTGGETTATCPNDCQASSACGDDLCNGSETSDTCPDDCAGGTAQCGNLACEAGEDLSCPTDCSTGGGGTCPGSGDVDCFFCWFDPSTCIAPQSEAVCEACLGLGGGAEVRATSTGFAIPSSARTRSTVRATARSESSDRLRTLPRHIAGHGLGYVIESAAWWAERYCCACSASTSATHSVSRFAVGMCRNSFGPCAFEPGPSTPVMQNCASGNFSPSMSMNGIVPPSPMYIAGLPKCRCDAASSACSSHGASAGASQPALAVPPVERDLRAVRRVLLEHRLDRGLRLRRIDARRDPHRQLERGDRAQHVAGVADRRPAVGAGDREARAPRAVEDQLDVVRR